MNRNYNGAPSQNWSQQTLNFQYDSTGYKTNTKTDVWTTSHNMEFKNTGNSYSTGQMELKENAVSKRLCVGNGELNDEYGSGGNREVKISGYSKGSSTERTDSVYLNGIVPKTLNWDGLLKVEIRAPSDVCICIDDVVVKT